MHPLANEEGSPYGMFLGNTNNEEGSKRKYPEALEHNLEKKRKNEHTFSTDTTRNQVGLFCLCTSAYTTADQKALMGRFSILEERVRSLNRVLISHPCRSLEVLSLLCLWPLK